VRDILKQIYAFAILHGEKVANPADDVGPASIATFTPKDRALSPTEIRIMLKQLEHVATLPTIRLGMKRSKPHNVYLCRQTLDIMIALKTCAGNSRYLLPSRYDADAAMSRATFNRCSASITMSGRVASRKYVPTLLPPVMPPIALDPAL
jgi:hypothetical protein